MAATPDSAVDLAAGAVGGTPALRQLRAEIITITGDDALLEQIGRSLDGESTVRHADSPAEARAHLRPSRPCVMLFDARGHEDIGPVLDTLHAPDGSSVIVIFAPADLSTDVARAVRGSAAFAVLPIPVEQAQATAIIEGACEEALARHALLSAPAPVVLDAANEAVPPAAVAAAPPAVVATAVRTPPKPSARSVPARRKLVAVGASLGLLVAVVVGAALLREPASAPHAAPEAKPAAPGAAAPDVAQTTEPESLQTASVDELLDSARTAIRERRYTDPAGNNALGYYRSVLAQEPDNGEAREGLLRIAAVLDERVRSALAQRRIEEAGQTLEQLRSLRPDDTSLAKLERTVTDARMRKALDEGDARTASELLRNAAKSGALPPEAASRWQAELDRLQAHERAEQLADLVSLRIRQGRLLQPQGDSAKHHLALLRRLPGDPRGLAARATTELQQAYLNKWREAVARSQRPEAERWKAEASAIGVTAAELSAVQREVTARAAMSDSKKDVSRLAQLVQDRIASGQLLQPAGDSAVAHLGALRAIDGSGSATASAERALSARLLEQGRSALEQRRLDVARDHASAARQLGVNLDAVASLERDIAGAGTPVRAAEAPPPPKPVRTRYVAPEYPKAALAQGLDGKVRLRLTVNAEGKVADAVVVQANPPEVFDAAAIAAVRKWRFKSLGRPDSGIEATALVDVVFQPEQAPK
ncbi:MAG TPA: energy transducer TonB [Steroidobacteraceae bacterium]|nr:energy transducer TonB [Steroidobacteraceae bacterium]